MAKTGKSNTETREVSYADAKVELRANEDGTKIISGQAIVFERESKPIYGAYIEVIKRGALDNANMERVVARTGHDDRQLLGTTMGETLRLLVTSEALVYDVDVPDTVAGRDTAVYIERGDIAGSSFAFVPEYRDGGVSWIDRSDEGLLDIREIHKIKALYDVSPVINPAYADSSVGLREHKEFREGLDNDKEKELRAKSDTLAAEHEQLKLKR